MGVGLRFSLKRITTKEHPTEIDSANLSRAMQTNCCIREHLEPTEGNIALLKKHQLKMVFHVRDLRQTVVSHAYYHLKNVRNNNPDTIKAYKNKGLDPKALTLNDFIELHIQQVSGNVAIIQGWLDVHKAGTVPMLITTYEEFHDNEGLFLEKILDFYSINPRRLRSRKIKVTKNQQLNFRKGSKDEWRETLTLDQQKRINDQIPDELFTYFGWER